MHKTVSGFTIVELLIVIVVIAILAAISTVSYVNVQGRAAESATLSNLSAISKQIELRKADLGRYPENSAEIAPITISKDQVDRTMNNLYYCLDIPRQTYSLGLRAKNLKGYMLSNSRVSEVSTVNGVATCNHIGVPSWVANSNQAVLQGYTSTTGNFADWTAG